MDKKIRFNKIYFHSQLFNTCIDMLCILIHSCMDVVMTNNGERSIDDCKRLYNNITRKLKVSSTQLKWM